MKKLTTSTRGDGSEKYIRCSPLAGLHRIADSMLPQEEPESEVADAKEVAEGFINELKE